MNLSYFHSKVVVITGGTGGLGMAMADVIIKSGGKVILIDKKTTDLNFEPNTSLLKKADIVSLDITDESGCKEVFDQIKNKYGRIDILINNAGITHIEPLNESHSSVIRKVMDVNFFGSVYCTLGAIRWIKESNGHLVIISSVAGFAPLYGRTAYAASKHALHGFFETLRTELMDQRVKVTMVCPSFIETGIRSSDHEGINQKKKTIGSTMTPEKAASILLQGVAKNKRTVLIGRTAKLSWWIRKWLPEYYDKKMLQGLGI